MKHGAKIQKYFLVKNILVKHLLLVHCFYYYLSLAFREPVGKNADSYAFNMLDGVCTCQES